MNRRNFLFQTAAAQGRPIRLGFVGVGDRGSYHLDICLGMDNVEVKAICDTNPLFLYRAKRWMEQAGKPSPALYDRGKTEAFRASNVLTKPECAGCWAKYFCSGGCAANSYHKNGDIKKPYALECQMERKRLECAIWLYATARK
jgi:radical SAM protein with 4Fe4S-binding SPASM domain